MRRLLLELGGGMVPAYTRAGAVGNGRTGRGTNVGCHRVG